MLMPAAQSAGPFTHCYKRAGTGRLSSANKNSLMRFAILCLLIAVSTGSVAQVAGDSILSPRDETAIQTTMNQFIDGWNRHDAAGFAAAFTTDADFTNVRGQTAHGRAAIDSFHVPIFLGHFKNSHQTMPTVKTRLLTADLAMVDAHWEMTGDVAPGTNQPVPLRKGLLSFVMKKSGAEWLILIMHNTDLPLN